MTHPTNVRKSLPVSRTYPDRDEGRRARRHPSVRPNDVHLEHELPRSGRCELDVECSARPQHVARGHGSRL